VSEQASQRPWGTPPVAPVPSPDAGWWRGEAAGIPPSPAGEGAAGPDAGPVARIEAPHDTETFPLWPTTTTVMVATPIEEKLDRAAHEAGATAVQEHIAERAKELERTQEHERVEHERVQEHARAQGQWPPPAMRAMRQARDSTKTSPPRKDGDRKVRRPRGPVTGLVSMLLIALLTGFFAWTSAEPFWLDMGHAVRGTAEVTSCKDSGILRRCLATFNGPGGEVGGVPLVGSEETPGTAVAARMVPDGRIAYAGDPAGLRVRWTVGLGLILLCGFALSWLTGAWRLGRLRIRLAAWSLTTAAPLILSAGILVASY